MGSDVFKDYNFTAEKYEEEDGSITLSLNEIDLVENGRDEYEARLNLGNAILEYSWDYWNEYELFNNSPNRKKHRPYVLKALRIGNSEEIAINHIKI